MSPSATAAAVAFVCVVATVTGLVSSVPMQQQAQQPREDGPAASAGGFATVAWSVLEDCFGDDDDDDASDVAEPASVCLKSKALTALDRALSKSSVIIAEGVSLTARAGKSLIDPHTERADRAALDAAKNSDQKDALLDDMLARRMDDLMTTRTIVMDGSVGQEGRKKKDKAMQQAMMMAGMMAAAVMGPMAFKVVALMAGKALLISKIALVLSGIIALKKLLQPQSGGHETETVSHHYGRSLKPEAHDMAYSGQKQ